MQGQQRRQLAKIGLDAAATLDPIWAPQVLSRPTQFSGPRRLRVIGASVYVGDTSGNHLIGSGSATKSARMTRLSRTGAAVIDLAYDPFADVSGSSANGPRGLVEGNGGGRLVVGGLLSELSAGQIRLGLAALNPDGSVDGLSALVEATRIAGVTGLAFDAATRASTSWAPSSRSTVCSARAAAIAAGWFGRWRISPAGGPLRRRRAGGWGRNPVLARFARIDLASGLVDTSFRYSPNAGGFISGLEIDAATSSLFSHGVFSSINGMPVQNLARIESNSAILDGSFAPAIPTQLSAVAADG